MVKLAAYFHEHVLTEKRSLHKEYFLVDVVLDEGEYRKNPNSESPVNSYSDISSLAEGIAKLAKDKPAEEVKLLNTIPRPYAEGIALASQATLDEIGRDIGARIISSRTLSVEEWDLLMKQISYYSSKSFVAK